MPGIQIPESAIRGAIEAKQEPFVKPFLDYNLHLKIFEAFPGSARMYVLQAMIDTVDKLRPILTYYGFNQSTEADAITVINWLNMKRIAEGNVKWDARGLPDNLISDIALWLAETENNHANNS